MKLHLYTLLLCTFCSLFVRAQSERNIELLDEGWKFSLGNASDPQLDFGCGTEYFNYLTKANSIHNEGPYSIKFDDSKWKSVRIPYDWVLQLPFDSLASHSHGYRAIGYKYPQNSVGWYRRMFQVGKEDEGKHITLRFDGIFRNATLWVNGFYMGTEPSGYATQYYDITDYIDYGGPNLITVRVDASLEEGWFYEGAGIYRNVWIEKSNRVHVAPMGTFIHSTLRNDYAQATISFDTEVKNDDTSMQNCQVVQILRDAEGKEVLRLKAESLSLLPKESKTLSQHTELSNPRLWKLNDPYLYTVYTEVCSNGRVVDCYTTTIGIREVCFDADNGFSLNGEKIKLKGVNVHQDHAGVGAAIPDALQAYRIKQLKSFGCNAYRASHNPMTPEMLDVCDREGILVIEENRLMGVNDEHLRLLERMIKRDRNHPCIILWSDGNEEWGLENNIQGRRVAASMRDYTHRFDPTRLSTAANAGGVEMIKALDVVGYNYLAQNDIDGQRKTYPDRIALGSEETSGCGTRGVYYDELSKGRMASLNRTGHNNVFNVIERGWKYYNDRPWLSGLFYWTGFDYRGESNPLKYPAVGSEFGILDYCGFYKDETYYLKSWWTDEPVLHVSPHWNLKGHEGETVQVLAYSNCEEVELIVNGKRLGRKVMERNGHLSWDAIYQPGYIKAIGYKHGKRVKEEVVYTTYTAKKAVLSVDRPVIHADNKDVAVVNIQLQDDKGNFVPTADNELTLRVLGNARIIGVGNGDPAFKGQEHPDQPDCKKFKIQAFNGLAQVLIQSMAGAGQIEVQCNADALQSTSCLIQSK